MKLITKVLTCRCGHRHEDGTLSPFAYGEFLLRSARDGTRRHLYAIDNPVYDELLQRIAAHPRYRDRSKDDRADAVQRVFGITCDGSLGSTDLRIRRGPKCPMCGSDEVVDWVIPDPPRFIECEIPSVTHDGWSRLSEAEKQAMLDAALAEDEG
ncbi:MAG: hypothetical protein KAI24_18980 [Planctomycetes bacterium]|nr:hypothetical protein [Planctomycetota bacterium]